MRDIFCKLGHLGCQVGSHAETVIFVCLFVWFVHTMASKAKGRSLVGGRAGIKTKHIWCPS